MPYPPYTAFQIDDITIPDFASRGMEFEFSPIDQSENYDTDVNGELVDLSVPKFRKYKISIRCEEIDKPVFDGVWAGKICDVVVPSRLGIGLISEGTSLAMRMMVTHWDTDDEEWEARGNWRLDLEQVKAGE